MNSILDCIGNTPLVKLRKVLEPDSANLFVKAEYLNPSGSLKDRIAVEMIRNAEESGLLKPGYTIIEAESMEVALSIAKACPFLDIGGSLEVSELVQMPGYR